MFDPYLLLCDEISRVFTIYKKKKKKKKYVRLNKQIFFNFLFYMTRVSILIDRESNCQ